MVFTVCILGASSYETGRANDTALVLVESTVQCPLDIATLDKAAALAIATATRVTDLRQYINCDPGYSDLKFSALYSN